MENRIYQDHVFVSDVNGFPKGRDEIEFDGPLFKCFISPCLLQLCLRAVTLETFYKQRL
jgi:hypothetical protein